MADTTGKITTDHDEIREWAQERCGRPATVRGTERGGEEAGLLRIDFPGHGGMDSLQEISWDEFFEKFEEKELAFLYQDDKKDGEVSYFCKLISREAAGQDDKPKARTRAKAAGKSPSSASKTKAAKAPKATARAKAPKSSKARPRKS